MVADPADLVLGAPVPPAPPIDPDVPHPIRMWDYMIGGKDNYESDRAAVRHLMNIAPDVMLIARASRTNIRRLHRDPTSGTYHDVSRHEGLESVPGIVIARVDGPLFFADADRFRERLHELVLEEESPTCVVVDAEAVPDRLVVSGFTEGPATVVLTIGDETVEASPEDGVLMAVVPVDVASIVDGRIVVRVEVLGDGSGVRAVARIDGVEPDGGR